MRKFLSFLLLGLLLSVGNAWADSYTITFKETGTGSDASTKRTTIEDIISTGDTYVSSISNATNVYNARTGRGIKLGTSSAAGSLTLNLASPVTPTKITFRARQYSNSETTITVNSNTVTNLTTSVDEYTINYDGNTSVSSIAISTPEKRAYITEVTVYYGVVLPTCATPTFTPTEGAFVGAQSVAINCATEGATIYYTTNGSNPTTSSSVYSSAISVSETTTIKAIAAKDGYNNSSVASATYTITQPLTTMDEIFAKATAVGGTATDVVVTFNNWIVTGIKGSNAYVTDGTKGFIIYQSNHGFSVGDILSGTASCKVQLYSGAAELTNLSSSTTGLVVNTGGVSTIANISLENLSGVNTGALIKCKYLTYDGTSKMLSDGTTDIKPYNGIYSGMSLTGGNVYSVMGIYIQFGNTKEICPRTAADITTHTTENLTIGETGYATYYNSASAYAIPYDCEGYVFTAANGLELAYDPGEEVPAGEALVLYTIAPGTKKLPITTCSEQTYASAGMNDLLGTDTETELTADADSYFYALQTDAQGANVGFYWMNNTGAAFTNGAHKAYLKLAKSQFQNAPSRILFNENGVTDIKNVEANEKAVKFIENGKLYIQKDGVVYDAMGKTVR